MSDMKRTRSNSSMGKRILQKMDELDLNAKQLSLKAGLNETYVRDLLKADKPNPRLQHLKSLANELGVTVEWLDSGDNEDSGAEIVSMWKHKLNREDRRQLIEYGRNLANKNDSA